MEPINEDNEKEINKILKQTNYSREKAIEELEKIGNYLKVIKNYMEIEKKEEKEISVNQQRYKEIRNFLNNN
jgi:hypothetical protein